MNSKFGVVPRPLECKGKLVGQKAPLKLQGDLGYPGPALPSLSGERARISAVSIFGASTASLRACDLLKLRCVSNHTSHGERIRCTGDRGATKDFKTRAVRDHGVDAQRFSRKVDQAVGSRV